jgi:hypothetical protein
MPRHSRQEQILQLKAVKRTWGTEFNKQLELGVKSPISRFYKYYQEQSDKAIEIFKRKGSVDAGDMVTMFTNNDYIKLYESLYESVGLRFAKWYAGNFDKFLQKAANPGANVDTWRTTFKSKGAQVAGERISLVQGSAKRNLMNVTRRLMMDDTFIESGYEDKARMLRSKFKQYNQYQAERLVRTEATFIANYATHESAKTIFPGADMQKEWISVSMGDYPRRLPKHKADHRVMDGVVVDFDKPFQVPTINGMENLMVPGDPNGSSYNVINCRCTSAPFPKPGAQAVTELQDLNFGLAGQMAEQSLYDLAEAVQTVAAETVAVANTVAKEPVEEVVDELAAKKEAMRPDAWNIVVPKDAEFNDDFLGLLERKIKIAKGSKSYQQGDFISIDTKRFGSDTIGRVMAHEFGHAIHIQRKWCVPYMKHSIDEVSNFYKLQLKKLQLQNRNAPGVKKIWDETGNFSMGHRNKIRADFPDLTDSQFREAYCGMADFFGAMTKNTVGWGHTSTYYRNVSWRHTEMLAHAFENKYFGNPVFKKLYPELYDDTIKWIDELIKL